MLKGLNFWKNKLDPVAMEDGEYPDWLWGVLGERRGRQDGRAGGGGEERGGGDLFCTFSHLYGRVGWGKLLTLRSEIEKATTESREIFEEAAITSPGADAAESAGVRAEH